MAQKGLWNLAMEKIMKEESCLMKKVMLSENTRLCMKETSGAACCKGR